MKYIVTLLTAVLFFSAGQVAFAADGRWSDRGWGDRGSSSSDSRSSESRGQRRGNGNSDSSESASQSSESRSSESRSDSSESHETSHESQYYPSESRAQSVPELDGGFALAALGLMAGLVLVFRERRKK